MNKSMKVKLSAIEVNNNDPFKQDAYGRKELAIALSGFVKGLDTSFVIGINSPWGSGKTTFLKMWKSYLEANECSCIYLNAWETDFTSDPLISLLSEINSLYELLDEKKIIQEKHINRLKATGSALAKRSIPVAAKILTAGMLDLDEIQESALVEAVGDGIRDAVSAFDKQKNLINEFRSRLSDFVQKLKQQGNFNKLIIFVDELDRCRPSYSVELLERVKHIFNIEDIVFILAIDKDQLNSSLKAIYGSEFNANEYLKRFIDMEYHLPYPDGKTIANNLINRFGYNQFFSSRKKYQELQYEESGLIKTLTYLTVAFNISIRSQEQYFTIFTIVIKSTPVDSYLYPEVVVLLVILKFEAASIYRNIIYFGAPVSSVISYLSSLPGGKDFVFSSVGNLIYARLLMMASNSYRNSNEIDELNSLVKENKGDQIYIDQAKNVLSLIDNFQFNHSFVELSYITNKIDLLTK
ncbi:P-loop NTPase fold protein [Methylobacillus methanolivorans]